MLDKRFSFATTEDFDKHIEKSIRGFGDLYNIICELSGWFLERGSIVYDIGCSTGRLIELLQEHYPGYDYVGIEREHAFIKKQNPADGRRYINADAIDVNYPNASIVTCIFTLQFIPQNKRAQLIKKIYDSINVGGAFIIAEKVRADSALGQDILTFAHYDYKATGFEANEILSKERDLRMMLKPITSTENIEMFTAAGFRTVEQFWQNYCFKAWLCVK